MKPEEMYERKAVQKRIDKLTELLSHDELHLFMRWLDETKKFLARLGGRTGVAFMQFAMPWLTLPYEVPESTPELEEALLSAEPPVEEEILKLRLKEKKIHKKIPHRDLQLHHISRVRAQAQRAYKNVIAKLRLDMDEDLDFDEFD